MEIRLEGATEAAGFFRELLVESAATGSRQLFGGAVKLDSVESQTGAKHKFDGSSITLWYTAFEKPTVRQIREAEVATMMFGIDRRRYTGKLVDVRIGKDGTLYILCGGILERRDEANKGMPAFRAFNVDRGVVLSCVLNAEPAGLAQKPSSPGVPTNGKAHGPMPTAVPGVQVPLPQGGNGTNGGHQK